MIRLRDKSSSGGEGGGGGGGGAYAQDKNTSAGLCAKNAGGAYVRGGGAFAGHYGISMHAAQLMRPGIGRNASCAVGDFT